MAGLVWVARLALRRLRREWRRLTALRAPRLQSLAGRRSAKPPQRSVWDASPLRQTHFFVDQETLEARTELVERLCPGARARALSAAEEILAHHFDLLGSGPTGLGPEIDWHTDFKTGYRWPLEHHLRLSGPPLGSGPDIKVPWELSRCHHFVTLGEAYAFTGDEQYAREFVAQTKSWLAANPPDFGVNWASPMEAAIRAVNWIWAYHFFEGAEALTPEFHAAFLGAMDAHGRYIIRNLENYWPPTNHLTANFCGLVYLGVMFPELRGSRRWLRRGMRGLLRALDTHVYEDGVADEGSTGYHRLVTELILSPALLLQLNDIPVPQSALTRLEKMVEVIRAYSRPDGYHPAIGDTDDGRLCPLGDPDPANHTNLLAIGAVFFDRPQMAAMVLDNQWEGAFWLFGERAADIRARAREEEAQPTSTFLPDGGLVFMRHEQLYLSLNAGPHGHQGNGGHNHNDTLSITLGAFNKPFLIDPGTFAYTGDIEARNHFRSTGAHNTLQVDGAEINRFVPTEVFRLNKDATPTVHRWGSTPEYDFVDVSHDGYARLPGAVNHRRQIFFDKSEGLWLMRDLISGEGEHELVWHYHFTPLDLKPGPEGAVTGQTEDGPSLLILPLPSATLRLTLSESWLSPRYGAQLRAPVAKYTQRAILPASLAVVLYPYRAEQPPYDLARAAGQRALARLDTLFGDETSFV
jgi:hypothetical protein